MTALHEHSLLDVVQYHTNLLEPRPDIYDFACKHNIGTQVRGVMAQGRLSGKYFHKSTDWQNDDRRSNDDIDYRRYAVFEKAVPKGMAMGQVAIRWILDQPGNHTICMGAKNLADYESAIAAAQMPPLSEETMVLLNEYSAGLK
jgi:aryl-alcohol dehydrogenase-like predicted oxidoreductase